MRPILNFPPTTHSMLADDWYVTAAMNGIENEKEGLVDTKIELNWIEMKWNEERRREIIKGKVKIGNRYNKSLFKAKSRLVLTCTSSCYLTQHKCLNSFPNRVNVDIEKHGWINIIWLSRIIFQFFNIPLSWNWIHTIKRNYLMFCMILFLSIIIIIMIGCYHTYSRTLVIWIFG